MADYIPQNDGEFNLWQTNLVSIAEGSAEPWGIPEESMIPLKTRQGNWEECFAIASNKQNRTSADVQAKDDARAAYEKDLRGFVAQWLSYNTRVSNSDRERMGLTVKSGSRTAAPKPTTHPVGIIDFSARMQHTIHYTDEASPRSKAKPAGVHGCEIWMKLGGSVPVEASELTYLTTDTRTPFLVTFDGADAGKTVYYWLRWVNTRSEHGPWSSAISAMVAG